jgi:hypothetical protein
MPNTIQPTLVAKAKLSVLDGCYAPVSPQFGYLDEKNGVDKVRIQQVNYSCYGQDDAIESESAKWASIPSRYRRFYAYVDSPYARQSPSLFLVTRLLSFSS